MADTGVGIVRGYACGSFTITSGYFYIFVDYFTLAAGEILTIEGTGIVRII